MKSDPRAFSSPKLDKIEKDIKGYLVITIMYSLFALKICIFKLRTTDLEKMKRFFSQNEEETCTSITRITTIHI